MLGFLFVDEADFTRDDRREVSTRPAARSSQASYDALAALPEWSTAAIEEALREALVEELGLKPRNAFGPVRVAVTGRRVCPPLFESLELLGPRARSLGRACAGRAGLTVSDAAAASAARTRAALPPRSSAAGPARLVASRRRGRVIAGRSVWSWSVPLLVADPVRSSGTP